MCQYLLTFIYQMRKMFTMHGVLMGKIMDNGVHSRFLTVQMSWSLTEVFYNQSNPVRYGNVKGNRHFSIAGHNGA